MPQTKDPLDEVRLGDIQTFLAVRRLGSITNAARELQVTPSQVSKAIARLERQLQAELLSRGPRGVSLSEAAARISPLLEQMVEGLRAARESVEDPIPLLTFAAPSYLNAALLPRVAQALPDFHLRAVELPPSLIRAYASENLFDVAVAVEQGRLPKQWIAEPLGKMRKSLFGRPDLVASLGPLPISREAARQLVYVTPVREVDGRLAPGDDGCPLHRGERRRGHEATTIRVALEIAARTSQVSFGPAIAAHEHVRDGRLAEIRVEGWEDISDPLFLLCNGDQVLARVQKSINATLTQALAELKVGSP
jgi:DNA-binding transcriptional LysR family regulator